MSEESFYEDCMARIKNAKRLGLLTEKVKLVWCGYLASSHENNLLTLTQAERIMKEAGIVHLEWSAIEEIVLFGDLKDNIKYKDNIN